MTFSEHLKKGLERAKSAVRNHTLIRALLDKFVSEVSRESGRGLQVVPFSAPLEPEDQRRHLRPSWQKEILDVTLLQSGGMRTVLLRVTKSPEGFPVEVAYADQLVWCVDETELESCLGAALENGQVASLLQPEQVTAAG
jgi:hypothetical protein